MNKEIKKVLKKIAQSKPNNLHDRVYNMYWMKWETMKQWQGNGQRTLLCIPCGMVLIEGRLC